ncbi:hypothetical protein AN218_04475 [Streptomyces nanshensis]|uniref:Uncharacterized protein n=1 Tax=Streptomyces nanshensis TaxID=518642 RepID=A0A1E7LAR2_9ACTN|nr:hypothetical protein AN218_04475 [Streptomyces nanshensis]
MPCYRLSQRPPQGKLTEAQYAPIREAADSHFDGYMRHRSDGAAHHLRYSVTVRNTVVAYLLFDGVVRIVPCLPTAEMREAAQLAEVQLGADPGIQQDLADERCDPKYATAQGLRSGIGRLLARAEAGSQFLDFPPGPVRGHRGPNPVAAYSEAQRREWAGQAAELLEVFRSRFPAAYALWHEDQADRARWRRGAGGGGPDLSEFEAGDRVGVTLGNDGVFPALVLTCDPGSTHNVLRLRLPHRDVDVPPRAAPPRLTPYGVLQPQTRELWARYWAEMRGPDWIPYPRTGLRPLRGEDAAPVDGASGGC